jgi:hypothetical protein
MSCARGERFAWVHGAWVLAMSLGSDGPTVVRDLPDHCPARLTDSDVRRTRNVSTGGGVSPAA